MSDRSETFMPNLVVEHVAPINQDALAPLRRMTHKPRILLLYGSLRERSFSRFAALEAARLLEMFGVAQRTWTDPMGTDIPASVRSKRT